MSDQQFSPFDRNLPFDDALSVLRRATDGANDGEIYAERKRAEMLGFDDGRLKTASYDASEGFGLRAVKGEVTGYAHSTEMTMAAPAAGRFRLESAICRRW